MAPKSGLKIDERRKRILEILRRDGQVRVSELSNLLGATVVTIRSDLDVLEQEGFLERTQGGAIQTVKNFYNLDFQNRKHENMYLKKAIASAVSSLVKDGETLLINSGTTTYYTAVELKKHKNLNIVTNSISVAVELGMHPSFRVILLGGDINAQYSFTYGKDAQEQLIRYKADKAILSVDGICKDIGLTTYHAEEAVINNTMIERSRETIIVADSSKFNHESFAFVTLLDKVNYWVTDTSINKESKKEIEELGIKVIFS
ncbi:MAG: DeoR/GlpR family DNA-binding transcription regulator [Actinomycetota bacterium]|nr:DeoR/GlpR family DNA-binding transcription regulator [Actinomycetota bacterium]